MKTLSLEAFKKNVDKSKYGEDICLFEISSGGDVILKSDIEYNCNGNQRKYPYRFEEYNWFISQDSLETHTDVFDMICAERGARCGGIEITLIENISDVYLPFFNDNNTVIIECNATDEPLVFLRWAKAGSYCFVINK